MRFKRKHQKPIDDWDIYQSYLKKINRFSWLCFLLLFLLNLFLFHEDEMGITNSALMMDKKRDPNSISSQQQTAAEKDRLGLIELEEE